MKRTLLEIAAGLAVVVLAASFHQQLTRLRVRSDEVAELRRAVQATAAQASAQPDVAAVRSELEGLLLDRIGKLEQEIQATSRSVSEATFLKEELEKARREAALIKAEVRRDVRQTRDLVQTYHEQLRANDQTVLAATERTHAILEELAGRVARDPALLTERLILPTVQLNGDDTVGSGTLVRSARDPRTGRAENWVLTSYHVVRNIHADAPRTRQEGIAVTLWQDTGKIDVKGHMVAHDERIDAALVRLDTDSTFDRVARVLPRSDIAAVRVWDEVFALGCPLGNDPIPTHGAISSTTNVLDGTNYWMINAPTYYGNSGGGVYLAERQELIGVFSKIYTHGRGTPVVIPHMGLCTPISAIYEWLEREGLEHVLPAHDEPAIADPAAHLASPGR